MNRINKLLFITLLLIYFNRIYPDTSTINIPTCKTIGLANEVSTVDNSGFSIITNPSLLSDLKNFYSFEYAKIFYYSKTTYDLLSIASNTFNKIGIGLVFGRFSSGEIQIRNIDGILTGESFEYMYSMFSLGVGVKLIDDIYQTFQAGFSGYTFLEKIYSDKIYFGFNNGVAYDLKFKNKFLKLLRIGIVIKKLSISKNFVYNIGLGLKLPESMLMVGYEDIFPEGATKYRISSSFNVYTSKDFKKVLKLNLGYVFNSDVYNISSGIELEVYNFLISYSYSTHKYLSSISAIQISFLY
ncbi:MAG: hypothetical protein ABDH23_01450 [Endomicrobiia bacterium]